MLVADLMSQDVSCCSTNDSLSVPARLMWDCDCGAVPVLDAQTGSVVGMITDRDICMATLMQNRPPGDIGVHQSMSHGVYSCSPDDSIADAEDILRVNQIRRLPVIDAEGRLVGILSLADIVRAAERERKRGRKQAVSEEITDTLGVICQPRPPVGWELRV
jgi:CBS domain-containing protein